MEFGLIVTPQFSHRWQHVVADARAAEDGGLDSIWLADHLLTPGDQMRGNFEAWTTVAALAALTERIRLGHLVGCVSFRNVGLLAKMAATVDHASEGRLELGLGAGWFEEEYRAFGYDFPSAGDRRRAFEEALDALDLLFEGEAITYEGEFVQLNGAVCQPTPVQRPRPPITIGTGGKIMRRLTGARAETWNCPARLIGKVDEVREEVDRGANGREVRTTVQIPVAVGRDREEAATALEVGRTHLAWMGDIEGDGLVGTIDEALAKVEYYRDKGVHGFMCNVPGGRSRPEFVEALCTLADAAR